MRIAIGIVLFAAGLIVGLVLVSPATTVAGTPVAAAPVPAAGQAPDADEPAIGTCVNIDQEQTPPALVPVGCADPGATYEVASRTAGLTHTCPTESYDPYLDPDGAFSLCLVINGHEGDCFTDLTEFTVGDANAPKSKVACTGGAQAVVTHRFERVDPAACGHESRLELVYPQQNRTICVSGGGF